MASAAAAHVAIDVLVDYVVPHPTYDDGAHASRGLVAGVALLLAFALAVRGVRACCEIAGANRTRRSLAAPSLGERWSFLLGVVAAAAALVPAMEYLDAWLDRTPINGLGDAYGGALLFGLAVTVVCAASIAAAVYGLARWLLSHRDTIAAIVHTLLGRRPDTAAVVLNHRVGDLIARIRRPALCSLTLRKRGPPDAGFQRHIRYVAFV